MDMTDGLLRALALLGDEAQVMVRVGDLRRAFSLAAGGPEVLDTKQASAAYGYRPAQWRRWAAEGTVADAWQDIRGGSWHMPRASCEAHIERLRRRGRGAERQPAAPPQTRSVPRGPWKHSA